MVMPCSRSASSPSSSRAKSNSSSVVPKRARIVAQRGDLVVVQAGGVADQPADQGRLAVIDRAAGEEAQLAADRKRQGVVGRRCERVGHQKYPSLFLRSMEACSAPSTRRPWRSDERASSSSAITPSTSVAADAMAPVSGQQPSVRKRTWRFTVVSPLEEAHALVVDGDQVAVAFDHPALGGEIERHDRDRFGLDVGPDVELGPVRQGEDPHRVAAGEPGVEQPPQLGPLVARVPDVAGRAMREDALLGARLLLVAPAAAEGGIEAVDVERLLQRLGQHQPRVFAGLGLERIDPGARGLLVGMHEQVQAILRGHAIAMLDQGAEIPARGDVQEGKRRRRREEGLARQMQHDAGILAHRIEHHRPAELGHDLAQDVDRLVLQPLQMRREARRGDRLFLVGRTGGGDWRVHGLLCFSVEGMGR